MKVLLTGANGYIGCELLPALQEAGHDVTCLTRSTQPPAGITADRHVRHDLREPLTLDRDDFDLILHAAGANDVQSRDAAIALQQTALTAKHCAQLAARQRNPRIAYVSTFQVYGSDEGAINESTPCRPVNDYALTHLFAEQWIEQIARTSRLQYVLLRPANIAGVPTMGTMQRWSLTPGCFCRDAVREQRIVVRSTGLQQRDFLPLAEIVRRTVKVCEDFDRYAGRAVNINSGHTLTIADVARLAASRYEAIFGRPCALEFTPAQGAADALKTDTLTVSGAYLFDHPNERLSRERSLALMTQCIDDTYYYLQRSA